ncbi:hypothetical protein GCM10027443_29660 [Pontibacter brevis]
MAFLDQATENPEFYRFLIGQINRYIRHLGVLHSRIAPHEKRVPDEREREAGEAGACHDMKLLMQLEQLEKGRVR